jgi:K+-transporting ATPase ATPase C chain
MKISTEPLAADYGRGAAKPTAPGALRQIVDQLGVAAVATLALTVLVCIVYPLAVWGIAQVAFHDQANGSLILDKDGRVRGSSLLGQNFAGDGYFHPRPSAAGAAGYDASSSGGTNLGPTSDKLINGIHGSTNADGTPNPSADFDGIKDLAAAYRKENNLDAATPVPADAVTRSASGLDPHIAPANAALQAPRVAKARDLSITEVEKLIAGNTDGRGLGILGEPGVNVMTLNLALDAAKKAAAK